ncbi:predicted protein [Lichtheimia corymbifera JMRC:FSU:9682]|uniref:Uncharacterized protein n=1 Tax=Lichtheimia corymbifera JMRC:FSU:9682 TaxID=1263082 RepID=A0A068RHL7_9FUNG|nr:predicted protein [Lichtheimia corymbifera JMRC:FSU:9682]
MASTQPSFHSAKTRAFLDTSPSLAHSSATTNRNSIHSNSWHLQGLTPLSQTAFTALSLDYNARSCTLLSRDQSYQVHRNTSNLHLVELRWKRYTNRRTEKEMTTRRFRPRYWMCNGYGWADAVKHNDELSWNTIWYMECCQQELWITSSGYG